MEACNYCPLSPAQMHKLHESGRDTLNVSYLKEIEDHVSQDINCPHSRLKDLILSEPLEGSSLLLLACDTGNFEAVERIVEIWGVDVRSPAIYYTPSKKKVLEASPLFVAAYRDHFDIVKYLVGKGADVSAKTSSDNYYQFAGLTPLHASVSCPYISLYASSEQETIVKCLLEAGSDPSALTTDGTPVWAMEACDPGATITLIMHGMSLTQRCPRSLKTILLKWASMGRNTKKSLYIVQLLVDMGVDLQARDRYGCTPLLYSALADRGYYSTHLNFAVMNFLLARKEIPNWDKINALELAGAIILSNSWYASQIPLAFTFWRRALNLRQSEADPTPKIPMVFKDVPRVEWTTLAQLQVIKNRPSQHKIQSLLVQLRNFSSLESCSMMAAVDTYLLGDLVHKDTNPEELVDYQDFAEAKDSLFIILEFVRCSNRPDFWYITVEMVRMLVALLIENPALLNSKILETSLELVLDTDQSHLPNANRSGTCDPVDILSYLKTLLQFVSILADHPELMNEKIMQLLHELVLHDGRTEYGKNLLLLACKTSTGSNSLAIVRLLLDAGADPNAIDFSDNGPLHVLVSTIRDETVIDPTARLLLNAGTHLDRVNKQRRTASDFWLMVRNKKRRDQDPLGWMDLPEWCRDDVPSLKCLSAGAVRRNLIPFEDRLPITLSSFTEIH